MPRRGLAEIPIEGGSVVALWPDTGAIMTPISASASPGDLPSPLRLDGFLGLNGHKAADGQMPFFHTILSGNETSPARLATIRPSARALGGALASAKARGGWDRSACGFGSGAYPEAHSVRSAETVKPRPIKDCAGVQQRKTELTALYCKGFR
jgi:hypothetical protein